MHTLDHSSTSDEPPRSSAGALPEAYQSILEVVGDAFVVVDADGQIVGFNTAAESVFGYRADEVIGGPLGRLVPDGARGAHRSLARAFTENSTGRRTMGAERPMVQGKRKDGEEFRAEITLSPLVVDGKPLTGALVRDVSHRLAAERALVEAEHNGGGTPLRSLLPYAELLRIESPQLPPTERSAMLQSIVDEANDLTILIDDLLVAAKLEHGPVNVARVPVDLRAQALQVLETWDAHEASNVVIQHDTSRALGDPARIRQILRNLIAGAFDRADRVQVVFAEDHAYARVSVVDAGAPLADDAWALDDEPLLPRSADELGAGFGLSVARRLAALMSGHLSYYRSGDENVFELEVPSAPQPGGPMRRFALKTRVGQVDG